ncbi:MAG: hypothetical protein U0Z53_16140 [Blastocatellia bacterium]
MSYQLNFDLRYKFQTTETGITIPFSLTVGELTVEGKGKLDTGSEVCFFQRELAQGLGLDVESGDPLRLGTMAGTLTGYGHRVIIQVLDLAFESTVYFTSAYGAPRNLPGRRGWLDNLHLALTMDDEMLYLNPAYSQENL